MPNCPMSLCVLTSAYSSHSQNDGSLRIEVVVCPVIEKCSDNKAPFKLEGHCCETCMYVDQLSFRGSSSGVEGDLRANLTVEDKIDKVDTWSDWSQWTECSRSCGGGRQSRMRKCETEGALKLNCTGNVVDWNDCNTQPCPGECLHSCTTIIIHKVTTTLCIFLEWLQKYS